MKSGNLDSPRTPTATSQRPAILAAMPAELASCAPLASCCQTLLTGVGEAAARRAAQVVTASRKTSLLVSWGTAGGLAPDLKPGTLVICTRIVDAASGRRFDTPPELVERLMKILAPLRAVRGVGLSVADAVTTRKAKSALHEAHGCAVTDMESAAIAICACEAGIPFLALRAVIDPAHSNLPTSALAGMANPEQPTRASLAALARRPWELPALCRLALWYRHSLHMLSSAALMMENAPGLFCGKKSR